MRYRFGNYEVDCDEIDLENIADIFRNMYLGIMGTTDEELKDALEREGYEVFESEDQQKKYKKYQKKIKKSSYIGRIQEKSSDKEEIYQRKQRDRV